MKWYLRELVHILKKIIKSIKTFNLRRQLSERNIYMRNATINGDDFSKLVVGDNVYINDAFLDLHDIITIEECVGLGHGVKILTGTHKYLRKGKERAEVLSKPVIIRRGAWIASYAIILPGTEIGENSVVAAGSVVRGKVPSSVLVAGNPAKVIKELDR